MCFVTLVLTLVTSTAALVTTAPELSVTVPRIVPDAPPWPYTRPAVETSRKLSKRVRVVADIGFLLATLVVSWRSKALLRRILPCPRRLSPFTGGGYSHWSSRIVNPQPGNHLRFAMKNWRHPPKEYRQIVIG